jgi:hypothetical protein
MPTQARNIEGVPLVRMHSSSILQLLVLRKAVSVCGDDEALSHVLNVSRVDLRRWIDGEEAAPLAVFTAAMRLVNDSYRKAAAGV